MSPIERGLGRLLNLAFLIALKDRTTVKTRMRYRNLARTGLQWCPESVGTCSPRSAILFNNWMSQIGVAAKNKRVPSTIRYDATQILRRGPFVFAVIV